MALMIAPEDERRGGSWRWYLLAAVLALPVFAIGVVAVLFDPNDYKPQIVAAVKQATGRDLVIDGKLHLSLALRPTIAAKYVRFSNAPGGSHAEMVSLERVEARIALLPLLQHQIEIDRLILVRPDVLLETNAQGHGNWRFDNGVTARPAAPRIPHATTPRGNFLVRSLLIQDGTLTWRDGRKASTTTMRLPHAGIQMESATAPISVQMDALWNETKLNISGQVGSLNGLQGQSAAPWPLRLVLSTGGAKLNMSGAIADTAMGKGYQLKLEGATPALRSLASLLPELRLPDLHDVRVSAEIADRGAALPEITSLSLQAGPSDLAALVPGLKLTRLELGAPRTDQPLRMTAEGNFDGHAIAVLASYGTLASLVGGGSAPMPLDMALSAGGARITLKGSLGPLTSLSGANLGLHATIPDLAVIGRLAGVTLPGLKDVTVQSKLLSAAGGLQVVLKDLQFNQEAIDLGGEISIMTAPGLAIQANVLSRRVDADALRAAGLLGESSAPASAPGRAPRGPEGRSEGQRSASQFVIPDDPLPFAALRLVDGDVRWRIGELVRDGESTRNIDLRAVLAGGKLKLDPFAATLPAGPVSGSLNVDASQAKPAVALVLRSPGLSIQQLYHSLGRDGPARGTVELDLDLRGEGESAHAIAGTATGHLGLAAVDGSVDSQMLQQGLLGLLLRGINQGALLGRDKTTDVRCFALRIDAKSGVGDVRALLLDSSPLYLDGNGMMQFGEERLALQMRTQLRLLGLGVAIALRVDGSFAAPRVVPSMGGNPDAVGRATQGTAEATVGIIGAGVDAVGGVLDKVFGGDRGKGLGSALTPKTACSEQLTIARGGRAGPVPTPAAAAINAAPEQPAPTRRSRQDPLQRLLRP